MNTLNLKIKTKDIFSPESLGQKCGFAVYTGVPYTWQNTVVFLFHCSSL